jgi:O-antigen/teichoic acid export membrane protein
MRALRDVGAKHELAGEVMTSSLAAKTLLVLVACLILLPLILFFFEMGTAERLASVLFLLGTLANSYGDLGLTVFRSIGQFHREARVVVITAGLHFAAIGLAVWLNNGLLAFGLAYLLSRLVYASLSLSALAGILSLGSIFRQSRRSLVERFRVSTSFAVDSGATNIFAQLDVILVNHLAGREAAGIYFAGSRLLQGAVPFSVLLAGIHIPRLANRLQNKSLDFIRYGLRVLVEYVGMGFGFAIIFLFLGPQFTERFLGSAYVELNSLWLAFACFTCARFIAAGLGVQLIALGTGFLRTFGIVVSGVITVACYWAFIPLWGVQAAPWVSTLGMIVLILIYGLAVLRIFSLQSG